jgi:hypothetical protein
MEYRLLGGSGFVVPALSLGTGTFGGNNEFFKAWGSSDVAEATRLDVRHPLLLTAANAGFGHSEDRPVWPADRQGCRLVVGLAIARGAAAARGRTGRVPCR